MEMGSERVSESEHAIVPDSEDSEDSKHAASTRCNARYRHTPHTITCNPGSITAEQSR